MDEKSASTDLDELLQHASWVKGLAFASLRDAALAEDVSQEVLLKALAGPRRTGRILRAWLAAVTRNAARNELRGIMRRRQREEKVARPEGDHSGQSQTGLLQAHRELTLAVEALSPKHREVIVLRFFEERSFKQMAAQLTINEGNVRVRLHRALHELRNLMSESGGDWRASCLVLAPMAVVPAPSISLPTSSKILLAASLTVLIGGAWWWLDRDDFANENLQSSVVAQVDPADAGPLDTDPEDVGALDGGAVSINRESITAPVDQEAVENEFRGMVLADGFPVAGAQVVVGQVNDLTRTTTAEDGTFTVELKSSARGVISAAFDGLYGMKRFDRIELFPEILLIQEPYEDELFFSVLDGTTQKGLPGARVEVFANWAGAFQDASFNSRKPDLISEHITDAEGRFPHPDGVPTELIEFRASAPGYISSWSEEQEATLYPGQELPVQLLDLSGSALANVEVATGVRPRLARTNVDGFVPDIRNWEHYELDGRMVNTPAVLMVRLADGRYWHMGGERLAAHLVEFEGVLQVTIDDTPIQVEVVDFPVRDGEFVEVACVNPYWQRWSKAEGSYWQRMEPGETSALTTGLVNPDEMIWARIMPNRISLGYFPVIDGKATVVPQLLPFKFTLEGPSVDAGTALTLMVQSDGASAKVAMVDGVAEVMLYADESYFCWVEKQFNDERILLQDSDRVWTTWTEIKPVDGKIDVVKREYPRSVESVLVRVDGKPVVSGHIGFYKIDMNGMGKMSFDSSGRPMVGSVGLRLPGEMVALGNGPTLTEFGVKGGEGIPGTLSRSSNGDRVWDIQLANVELWVPATDSSEPRQFRISKGEVRTSLLYPNEGAPSNMMFVPAEAGWYVFRLPAGKYAFKVGDLRYGGVDGVEMLGGQLTQLHADPVEE